MNAVGHEQCETARRAVSSSRNLVTRRSRMNRNVRRAKGVAYILILGLVSITMALSYSMLRSQVTATLVQDNLSRQANARDAARAGLNIALRSLNSATWGGIGSTVSGSLSSNQSYSATFSAGDPSLDTSNPDPFLNDPAKLTQLLCRVTIVSTGTALSSDSPTASTYKIRAVAELVRRKLDDPPTNWSDSQNFTVYQLDSNNSDLKIEMPAQINGAMRIGRRATLATTYPTSYAARDRYVTNLSSWTGTLGHDARPLTSNSTLDVDTNNSEYRNLMADMGLTATSATSVTPVWAEPSSVLTYRLYPNGPLYNAYQIPTATLTGVQGATTPTLQPTLDNPLGIYHRAGSLTLGNDAWIKGTIILSGGSASDLIISGSRVRLEAASMVRGLTATNPSTAEALLQLPVADVSGEFLVAANSSATVTGQVLATRQFRVASANRSAIDFVLNGRIITKNFYIEPRSDWQKTSSWWTTNYLSFLLSGQSNYVSYVFLFDTALWPDPWSSLLRTGQIRIGPPPTSTTQIVYARKDSTNTIYEPATADIETTGGTASLIWELVDRVEGI